MVLNLSATVFYLKMSLKFVAKIELKDSIRRKQTWETRQINIMNFIKDMKRPRANSLLLLKGIHYKDINQYNSFSYIDCFITKYQTS